MKTRGDADRAVATRPARSSDAVDGYHAPFASARATAGGFSYLLDSFVPLLLEAGIGQQAVTSMLQHNPNRFFK